MCSFKKNQCHFNIYFSGMIELSNNKVEYNDRVPVSTWENVYAQDIKNSESTEIFLAVTQKAIFKYEGQQCSLLMSFHLSCYSMGHKISKQLGHCDLIYHFLLFSKKRRVAFI